MTNTSRPRLPVPLSIRETGGQWIDPATGRFYFREGSKWKRGQIAEGFEPAPRQRSARKSAPFREPKIPLNARERLKPFIESMSNWQHSQWVRGLAGGQPRSVDPRRLLFHVCFRKPPLKPLRPADGQAIIDAYIDRQLARKMGQNGPRLGTGIGLDGVRPPDSGALRLAWKATKDFLARQRRRWEARATRAAQRAVRP